MTRSFASPKMSRSPWCKSCIPYRGMFTTGRSRYTRKRSGTPVAALAAVGCCRRTRSGLVRHGSAAPRTSRRSLRKTRRGRIPVVFDRGATQRSGMHRRPNATVIANGATARPVHPSVRVRRRTRPVWRRAADVHPRSRITTCPASASVGAGAPEVERMTLADWVALAMLWWKGGGRPAIVRWLVELRGAARMGAGCRATLETVVAAIDPGLAALGRLAKARAAARGALEAAQAASPPSPGRIPATRRRWPRSQTRPRSCGSAATRMRSGHPRLRLSARAPVPRMPAVWAGSWDPDWRDAASQWSADSPGASTRPRIEVRWLSTVARLVYWALVWTSCTLPSTAGWRVRWCGGGRS